jgi:hypothetical protein
MAMIVFPDDVHVVGTLSSKLFNPPSGSIDNDAIEEAAEIDATKVVHRHFAKAQQATTVVAATDYLHIARAAGTLIALEAMVGTVATGADRTITIDLQKSTGAGAFATVLSSTLVLDNTNVARTLEAATINTTAYVDGDIFKLTVAVAGAAGAQAADLLIVLTYEESPQ